MAYFTFYGDLKYNYRLLEMLIYNYDVDYAFMKILATFSVEFRLQNIHPLRASDLAGAIDALPALDGGAALEDGFHLSP